MSALRRTGASAELEFAAAEPAARRGRRRPAAAASLLLAIVLLATGCDGDDGGGPAGESAAAERTASAERFRGERRAIARTIEAYEAAVRAGDASTLCREILLPASGRRARAAVAACVEDPDNPARRDRAEGEALDLAVRRIALLRRAKNLRGLPAGLPEDEVEWSLRGTPRAVALVDSVGSDRRPTAFGLNREGGDWRIRRYWRSREIDRPQEKPTAFLHREGIVGFYGIAGPERARCRGGQSGIVWDAAPVDAANAKAAVVNGLAGEGVRKELEASATLTESAVSYPGPRRSFILRDPSGRPVAVLSVSGAGPDYGQDGIEGCRSWVRRLAGY